MAASAVAAPSPCPLSPHIAITASQRGILEHVLQLVAFVISQHTWQARNYMFKNSILKKVGPRPCPSGHVARPMASSVPGWASPPLQATKVMGLGDQVLNLTLAGVYQTMVKMEDSFIHRHLVSMDLLDPLVEMLLATGERYNLLNSALLEIFEHILKVGWGVPSPFPRTDTGLVWRGGCPGAVLSRPRGAGSHLRTVPCAPAETALDSARVSGHTPPRTALGRHLRRGHWSAPAAPR